MEDKYINAAKERINKIKNESNDISNLILEIKPPRISTKQLIELNLLIVNEELFDKNNNSICKINEDGKAYTKEEVLSIHKMSAKILHKNNHNGWDYFYVKRNNKLISINELRYIASEQK